MGNYVMKLIKKLDSRRAKNGRMGGWALFYCPYCEKEVEKPYQSGLRYKSCGCAMHQLSSESLTVHGDNKRNKNGKRKPGRLYRIYNNMKQRCCNVNNQDYNLYGGRGIKVCKQWEKSYIVFKIWALLHGYKDNLTIDRINSNKGYSPDNCQWATQAQQVQNSSKAKLTWVKVHLIRQVIHNKLCSIKELANIYNVSMCQIGKIVNNKCWKEEIEYGCN